MDAVDAVDKDEHAREDGNLQLDGEKGRARALELHKVRGVVLRGQLLEMRRHDGAAAKVGVVEVADHPLLLGRNVHEVLFRLQGAGGGGRERGRERGREKKRVRQAA